MAVRRGRIDAEYRRAALADLASLEVVTDQYTDLHAWRETSDLADRYRLAVCDAAYLELARRRSLPLATLDGELRDAASQLGITLEPC